MILEVCRGLAETLLGPNVCTSESYAHEGPGPSTGEHVCMWSWCQCVGGLAMSMSVGEAGVALGAWGKCMGEANMSTYEHGCVEPCMSSVGVGHDPSTPSSGTWQHGTLWWPKQGVV